MLGVRRFLHGSLVAAGLGWPLAAAAAVAYVPNEGSGTVSLIDTATDKVTATLKFGEKPRGIAI